MNIFPAIDLYEKKAVRLERGDYSKMTVYGDDPVALARSFEEQGARYLHTVDLAGARDAGTPDFDTVAQIVRSTSMFVEIGGGIRSIETLERYLDAGVSRVILGTAAVNDPSFLHEALSRFKELVAVGVDVRDGFVAVNGWLENSSRTCMDFCRELNLLGASCVICTDISRDGMLGGTNTQLYRELVWHFPDIEFVASGGVSTLGDITSLKAIGLGAAIVGKALYEQTIDLGKAIEAGK